MDKNSIAPGDIVTLKSGGPKMVVERISMFGNDADVRYWNEKSEYFDYMTTTPAALKRVH